MVALFSFLLIAVLPLFAAGYLAYRIKVELKTGRSYLRGGWSNRATEPKMYWLDITIKAFGVAVFLYLPLSILLASGRTFTQ